MRITGGAVRSGPAAVPLMVLELDRLASSAAAHLCLDAAGAATANGTELILWTCNGQDHQELALIDVVVLSAAASSGRLPRFPRANVVHRQIRWSPGDRLTP
ncbi:hypothetical protein [Streptomyces sp. NBC_00847]|uniref:hypothetical protein n=2 Tax=unclassified Streptomyces TaxID=2593676 RepID=UPI002B1E171C|nr:hypothetical protein [Streptomyces sp. NBC_00847]